MNPTLPQSLPINSSFTAKDRAAFRRLKDRIRAGLRRLAGRSEHIFQIACDMCQIDQHGYWQREMNQAIREGEKSLAELRADWVNQVFGISVRQARKYFLIGTNLTSEEVQGRDLGVDALYQLALAKNAGPDPAPPAPPNVTKVVGRLDQRMGRWIFDLEEVARRLGEKQSLPLDVLNALNQKIETAAELLEKLRAAARVEKTPDAELQFPDPTSTEPPKPASPADLRKTESSEPCASEAPPTPVSPNTKPPAPAPKTPFPAPPAIPGPPRSAPATTFDQVRNALSFLQRQALSECLFAILRGDPVAQFRGELFKQGEMMKSQGAPNNLVDEWVRDLSSPNWDHRGTRAMVLLSRLGREWAGTYARALMKVKGMPRALRSMVREAASAGHSQPN